MFRKLSDISIYFYEYCIVKSLLYSASTLSIFLGFSSSLLMPLLATISSTLDLLVISILTRYFFKDDANGGRLGKFLLLASCVVLILYPLAWDDLSYGLVLPHEYLAHNSFEPISEYGVFTYFPFIEYGRTALSFAFGDKLQIILYRIEGLAFYLITFVSLLQISWSASLHSKKNEFSYFVILLLMTTVSAFSVYAFVKPESFTTTCFAIAALSYINGKSSKAIISVAIAIPFKYTAVITGLPIIILALSKIRHEFQRIRLLEIIGCTVILLITALWLSNNYLHTSSPFYPLLLSFFPYGGDGVMNGSEYKRVIEMLLNQQDVSPKSIVSFKYFKYIATQLGGSLLFLPLFLFLVFKGRLRNLISSKLFSLATASSVALIFFLLILFSEFRYIYLLICIIDMAILLAIHEFSNCIRNNNLLKIIIFLICLQLTFVLARNYKNSIYEPSLSLIPINLSSEQRDGINCIRSSPNLNARTATFDQTFYLWKSPFFFIHELNEYIGLNPSLIDIQYAFQKFDIRFILLRDDYMDRSVLLNLKFGGMPRLMPNEVMGKINKLYDLREVKTDACLNAKIYELLPRIN